MKKLSEAVKMIENYLNDCTYSYEIINCNVRKDKKDYEFNIIEYCPLYTIQNEYPLYIDFNSDGDILNAFGDVVNGDF